MHIEALRQNLSLDRVLLQRIIWVLVEIESYLRQSDRNIQMTLLYPPSLYCWKEKKQLKISLQLLHSVCFYFSFVCILHSII